MIFIVQFRIYRIFTFCWVRMATSLVSVKLRARTGLRSCLPERYEDHNPLFCFPFHIFPSSTSIPKVHGFEWIWIRTKYPEWNRNLMRRKVIYVIDKDYVRVCLYIAAKMNTRMWIQLHFSLMIIHRMWFYFSLFSFFSLHGRHRVSLHEKSRFGRKKERKRQKL